ncbi:aldo/keto reductase [Succinatimonas hippei]|uniref:aldo/keto reductase n=1 Tax=Succinatimonas hippei TaxID=626938 RepID=UPI0024916E6C|nr:aldo/keto reductase [Succinatimonas hippei]
MEYVTLNNGVKMPILGFGVFQVTDKRVCLESVLNALETGYRLIDTAHAYGNEDAVGEALSLSGIKREELFITTKLWISDAGYQKAKEAFYSSLKKLKLEYLDLYLIHQPLNDYYGAYRAMEELYKEGVIRAIGVSNFYADRLVDLVHFNEITPQVNQIEVHPFFQRKTEHEAMDKLKIQIEGWAPFAEGRHSVFDNDVLKQIAANHQKTVAQVVLNFLTSEGIVCIPKSVHKERIEENFNIFDFTLSDKDREEIKALDLNQSAFFDHRDYKSIEYLCNLVR